MPERSPGPRLRAPCRPAARILRAIVLGLACCLPGAALGQAAPGAAEPLRPGPADFWAEVHRWTGSEATRPAGAAARPAPGVPGRVAPAPGALRQVVSSRRSRANLRRDPGLEAPILRVLPPGTPLNVFAEADGGWLQVGEDRAVGWVHESVLDR